MARKTITFLNRFTDERETIPDNYDAIDEFFQSHDPHAWIEDSLETDDPVIPERNTDGDHLHP